MQCGPDIYCRFLDLEGTSTELKCIGTILAGPAGNVKGIAAGLRIPSKMTLPCLFPPLFCCINFRGKPRADLLSAVWLRYLL
jgi:hypothetical protein